MGSSQANILHNQIEEDLVYRPTTAKTKQIYEQFLQIVARYRGDESIEVIKGAGDEVLSILKTENFTDHQRKLEIEAFLDKISDEDFNQLTVLAQSLIDFNPEERYGGGYRQEEDLEVNVEFEDDEENEEGKDLEEINVNDQDGDQEYGQEEIDEKTP